MTGNEGRRGVKMVPSQFLTGDIAAHGWCLHLEVTGVPLLVPQLYCFGSLTALIPYFQ